MAAQTREQAIFQSILHSKGLAAARAWAKKQPKDAPKGKGKRKAKRGKGYVPRSKQGNPFAGKQAPPFGGK